MFVLMYSLKQTLSWLLAYGWDWRIKQDTLKYVQAVTWAFWVEMNKKKKREQFVNDNVCQSVTTIGGNEQLPFLSVCQSVCVCPPVCQSVSVFLSVCRISSLSLHYRAEQEINNYSVDSLPRSDCLKAAGRNQWLRLKCPNACMLVCVGIYTHEYEWGSLWTCAAGPGSGYSVCVCVCVWTAFCWRSALGARFPVEMTIILPLTL